MSSSISKLERSQSALEPKPTVTSAVRAAPLTKTT